jgi:hypothetical protein
MRHVGHEVPPDGLEAPQVGQVVQHHDRASLGQGPGAQQAEPLVELDLAIAIVFPASVASTASRATLSWNSSWSGGSGRSSS